MQAEKEESKRSSISLYLECLDPSAESNDALQSQFPEAMHQRLEKDFLVPRSLDGREDRRGDDRAEFALGEIERSLEKNVFDGRGDLLEADLIVNDQIPARGEPLVGRRLQESLLVALGENAFQFLHEPQPVRVAFVKDIGITDEEETARRVFQTDRQLGDDGVDHEIEMTAAFPVDSLDDVEHGLAFRANEVQGLLEGRPKLSRLIHRMTNSLTQ